MKNQKIFRNSQFGSVPPSPLKGEHPFIIPPSGGKGAHAQWPGGTHRNKKGFTLVELIVSVAITAILMVGISVFFSSTFRNMFQAQTQASDTQSQFAINEILRSKFTSIEDVVAFDPKKPDHIISFNKNTKGQMPFSYIGTYTDAEKKNRLVFKDFMPFSKMDVPFAQHLYADSGNGQIKNAENGNPISAQPAPTQIKNFSSFVKVGKVYYVVMPHENKILETDCSSGTCSSPTQLEFPKKYQLRSPTDVVVDKNKNFIYISDSENGRILRYKIDATKTGPAEKIIGPKIKYPTGMAYYHDGTTEWLFVAETFNNKIIKINLSNENEKPTTVAGDGDDTACNKITATFCKLNMPTGIYVNVDKEQKIYELYIADSGNNRILKIKDPGTPTQLTFKIDADKNYALGKVVFENENWTGGSYAETIMPSPAPYIMPIGGAKHYNPNTKTFSNTETLTTFVNNTCKSESNAFYVNGDINNMNIDVGDTLIVGDKEKIILTVASAWDTKDCEIPPSTSSLPTGKIIVEEDASQITNGLTVYPANPKQMAIQINSPTIEIKPGFSGFQKFTIKIYDFFDGLVYTAYQTERIGDGKIGTPEDTIEVVAENKAGETKIKFPTGVTNTYFANSGVINKEGKSDIFKTTDTSQASANLSIINPASLKTFDYTSDFALTAKNGIQFNQPNKKILEMVIKAKTDETDETKIQTYKLNATLK